MRLWVRATPNKPPVIFFLCHCMSCRFKSTEAALPVHSLVILDSSIPKYQKSLEFTDIELPMKCWGIGSFRAFNSPVFSFSPTRSTAKAAVEPGDLGLKNMCQLKQSWNKAETKLKQKSILKWYSTCTSCWKKRVPNHPSVIPIHPMVICTSYVDTSQSQLNKLETFITKRRGFKQPHFSRNSLLPNQSQDISNMCFCQSSGCSTFHLFYCLTGLGKPLLAKSISKPLFSPVPKPMTVPLLT